MYPGEPLHDALGKWKINQAWMMPENAEFALSVTE
jgi:hypothetical protein